MVLLKCFKHDVYHESFTVKNFIGWNMQKFGPTKISLFTVISWINQMVKIHEERSHSNHHKTHTQLNVIYNIPYTQYIWR